MTSCCANGRCIHCRHDFRWFVAGLSALVLVSVSDNVEPDRGVQRPGVIASTVGPHLANIADWMAGQSPRQGR